MKYVLFREDHKAHREVYIEDVHEGKISITETPREAIPFTNAREAYEFGGYWGLDSWRAGQR